MRLAVSWLVMVCACATVPVTSRQVDPEPSPISEPLLAPLTLSIADPAIAYNEPFAASSPAPLAEAVRAAMQDAAGTRGEITADPRLDVVCSELATVVSRDAPPSNALVELALHSHGIAEPAAHIFVAWTAATPADVIAAMQPQWGDALAGRMRAGIGTAPAGPIIAIVVHSTGIDLVATPRAVAAHGGFELTATIDPRVELPQLTITRDNGAIERPAAVLADGGRTLHAPFACDEHTGRQWIEIDATGLGGTLPRVVVPILCGGTWPASFAVEPSANFAQLADPAEIERRLTSIINRQRARAGLSQLRSDPRVAASARQRARSLAHPAQAGAEPSLPIDRLRAAGVAPLAALESVLDVDSVGHAAEELMNDAPYRAQLESPASTDVGVGIDATGGHLVVAIMYLAFPPRIDAPAVASCIGDAIDAVEGSQVDPELSRVAQRYAEGLASGSARAGLWPEINLWLRVAARSRYAKVSYATARAIQVGDLDPLKLVPGDHHLDDIGVGVAQGPRYGDPGGVTWAVVFFAERHRRLHWFGTGPQADTQRCLAAASGR